MDSPPPLPLKCCTPIVQNNSSHTRRKEREEKLEFELIQIKLRVPQN